MLKNGLIGYNQSSNTDETIPASRVSVRESTSARHSTGGSAYAGRHKNFSNRSADEGYGDAVDLIDASVKSSSTAPTAVTTTGAKRK